MIINENETTDYSLRKLAKVKDDKKVFGVAADSVNIPRFRHGSGGQYLLLQHFAAVSAWLFISSWLYACRKKNNPYYPACPGEIIMR